MASLIPPALQKRLFAHLDTSLPLGSTTWSDLLSTFSLRTAWNELVQDSTDFIGAVDWSEPFLCAIIGFHIFLFAWIVGSRNMQGVTTLNFFGVGFLALLASPLNDLGKQHWKSFSNTNYFDRSGLFMTLVWAAPLMMDLALIVIFLVSQSISMLVEVKRLQLRQKEETKKTR
ncbi:transmembrane protein 18-domain-containing protein [Phlyctochytrium arcticum]|nr:transmembrane protein 18-domain-containing protein [Phlyctochytrium arcticum]